MPYTTDVLETAWRLNGRWSCSAGHNPPLPCHGKKTRYSHVVIVLGSRSQYVQSFIRGHDLGGRPPSSCRQWIRRKRDRPCFIMRVLSTPLCLSACHRARSHLNSTHVSSVYEHSTNRVVRLLWNINSHFGLLVA